MRGNIVFTIFLVILFSISGCSDDNTTGTTTGSLAVRLIWAPAAEKLNTMPRNLPADAVTVRATITSSDMNTIQRDFPAADRQGTIDGVPAGSNRNLTIQALDSQDALLANCKLSGLLVEAGKTTEAGDCMLEATDGSTDPNDDNNNDTTTDDGDEPEPPKQDDEAEIPEPPKMIPLSGGCFEMGSPGDEPGRRANEAQNNICMEAFEISPYEVTRGEFQQFVDATGYVTDAENNTDNNDGCYVDKNVDDFGYLTDTSWHDPKFTQTDAHPVVCVSLNDATAYAEWLSNETGNNYRLPTEAEWEYAARADTTTAFHYGSDPDQICAWGNVADQTAKTTYDDWVVANCDDGHTYTAPIGQFGANSWNLHDMHGNVWEWNCSIDVSEYDGSKENTCLSKDDPSRRALRSGSWDNEPLESRSAAKIWLEPTYRASTIGFRLIKKP